MATYIGVCQKHEVGIEKALIDLHAGSRIILLLNVLLAIFAGIAFGQEYPPDIQKIKDKNKIVVAMYAVDQPPFFKVTEDGQIHGFDIELAKGIAKELGVEVEFNRSAKTFNQTVDMVVNKEADIVISKLSSTLERSKKVLFTKPYITLRKGLLVNRLRLAQATKEIENTDFIKNLTGDIGVVSGSSYVGYAQQMFPNATIKEYPTWEKVVVAVDQGKILAAFRDELELKKAIMEDPDSVLTLQAVVFKDTKDPIAIAVSNESFHLHYWLNQYLELKNIDMNVDKLLERYKYLFK